MRARPTLHHLATTLWMVSIIAATTSARGQAPADPPPREKIVVATKVFKPFAFKNSKDEWIGFSIDLWAEIADAVNVDFSWYGTESVTELLDAVRSGPAQVATAGITITSEREQDLDFSFPFFESGLQIMVKAKGSGSGSFLSALLPGLLRLMGMGILVLLLIAHLAWFAERKKNPEMFPTRYGPGIWEAFWWAAVTLTTVGYGDRIPRSGWGRGLALMWMFSGIILISYFTATVTTSLTIERLEGSVNGPSDLPGKRVGTARGSTAAKYLYSSAVKIEEYEAIEQAYEALVVGKLDAVVYDSPALLYYSSHEGNGLTRVVGKVFQKQSYGIAIKEKSPLRERINQALLKVRESGAYEDIYKKWFGS